MGKNDDAWEKIFSEYNILNAIKSNGCFRISSSLIKKYREPRLMTKFDHSANLPKIFSDNNLSILPITRGDYIIGPFSTYHVLEENDAEPVKIAPPSNIQTLALQFVVSEAIALNLAYSSGIIEDFLEDDRLMPTVNGRMSSGKFNFFINAGCEKKSIPVDSSQIEIDAAYEGVKYLSLFEAKNDVISRDFLVRQLYYPYRAWKDRVTKNVKSIFMEYSNGLFCLFQYEFEDPLDYNSLLLTKFRSYLISPEISISDIENLLKDTQIIKEPKIPFPQANSMARVINLFEELAKKDLEKEEITLFYKFDKRQTDYYTNALLYLGLAKKCGLRFSLSKLGLDIINLPYREKQLAIARLIIRHGVFNKVLRETMNCGVQPDRRRIAQIMKECNIYNVDSEKTFKRRASSIYAWIKWIISLINSE